jgi:hypothetical protein
MISLSEFLRTGRLGRLATGQNRQAFCEVLGPPVDEGRGLARLEIGRFCGGAVEVTFQGGAAVLIAFYFGRDAGSADEAAIVIDDVPNELKHSSAKLVAWSTSNGIRATTLQDDGNELVRLEIGVVASYVNGRLDSLQAVAP